MKSLKQIIQEKLVIDKTIKSGNNSDFYCIIAINNKAYKDLQEEFSDALIAGPPDKSLPCAFIFHKDIIKFLDIKYIKSGEIKIYDFSEKYNDDIDKFEKDYSSGKIKFDDFLNTFKKLKYEDIQKID